MLGKRCCDEGDRVSCKRLETIDCIQVPVRGNGQDKMGFLEKDCCSYIARRVPSPTLEACVREMKTTTTMTITTTAHRIILSLSQTTDPLRTFPTKTPCPRNDRCVSWCLEIWRVKPDVLCAVFRTNQSVKDVSCISIICFLNVEDWLNSQSPPPSPS